MISNVTFPAGRTCECEGAISITIESDVLIERDAVVSFSAPVVNVRSGVVVKEGAVLTIKHEK